VPLPANSPEGVLLGAFDLKALRELERWRRLIHGDFPDANPSTVLVAASWAGRARRQAESAFAPSQLASVKLVSGEAADAWRSLLEPKSEEEPFVVLSNQNRADLLMVGPATESAWDVFEPAARAFLSR